MGLTAFRARRLPAERLAYHVHRIPALQPRLAQRFATDLRDLHDALEQTDLRGRYWVWSGLLLGWAREGAILRHDSLDADFAFADSDFPCLLSAVPTLVRAGFSCDRRFVNNAGQVTEVTFRRRGASFDFFRMFPDDGALVYYLYGDDENGPVEVEKSLPHQPLAPFSFLGRTWHKHEDHELELRTLYGTWEVPDTSWNYLSGPNVRGRQPWQRTAFDWRGGAAELTAMT